MTARSPADVPENRAAKASVERARILVIRRDNIGDLVCATPLFAALRRHQPDAHIAALVNSYNAGVLEGNPDLDAVHAYTKLKHRMPGESLLGTALASWRLLSALRKPAFDHVILAKSGFDRHGLAMARRIRARNIIGFAAQEPVDQDLHEVEIMMQLGARIGVTEPPGPVRVFAAPDRVARWRSRLSDAHRHWIALHIRARKPGFDHVILAKSGFDRHGLAMARRIRARNIIGFAAQEPVDQDLHEVEIMMQLGARIGVTEP